MNKGPYSTAFPFLQCVYWSSSHGEAYTQIWRRYRGGETVSQISLSIHWYLYTLTLRLRSCTRVLRSGFGTIFRSFARESMAYHRSFTDAHHLALRLCRVALPGWDPILRELEQQMMTEFDYTREAHNLQTARANILKSPFANRVKIPEPKIELFSKNVLVMEYLNGKKLAEDARTSWHQSWTGTKTWQGRYSWRSNAHFLSRKMSEERRRSRGPLFTKS